MSYVKRGWGGNITSLVPHRHEHIKYNRHRKSCLKTRVNNRHAYCYPKYPSQLHTLGICFDLHQHITRVHQGFLLHGSRDFFFFCTQTACLFTKYPLSNKVNTMIVWSNHT